MEAVKAFMLVQSKLRLDKAFIPCHDILGTYCIGPGKNQQKRRHVIAKLSTTLCALKYLQNEMNWDPEVSTSAYVSGVLLSTQISLEKLELFHETTFELLPSARQFLETISVDQENIGKTIVFNRSEQLECYEWLITACSATLG